MQAATMNKQVNLDAIKNDIAARMDSAAFRSWIAPLAFSISVSYFYDNSTFKPDISKTALIYDINTKLNVLSKTNLQKIRKFIDIIE